MVVVGNKRAGRAAICLTMRGFRVLGNGNTKTTAHALALLSRIIFGSVPRAPAFATTFCRDVTLGNVPGATAWAPAEISLETLRLCVSARYVMLHFVRAVVGPGLACGGLGPTLLTNDVGCNARFQFSAHSPQGRVFIDPRRSQDF